MNVEWEPLLSRLAGELIAKGKLTSPRWQAAFRLVPRHVFVPEYLQQDQNFRWERIAVDNPETIATVYSNIALFTDVDERGHGVSSSSMPGLMTRMLEMLDVSEGQKVLEIGTGTGYNTALLCAGLGDHAVHSIDVDYVDAAATRLAGLGYRPTLATRNGIDGMPSHAPFDRIISTVAVPYIPTAWVEQLAEGGAILADIKINQAAGNLVLLRKHGALVEGRFDEGQAWFMPMRHPGAAVRPAAGRHDGPIARSTSTLDPVAWNQPVPWFLACLEIGGAVDVGFQLDDNRQPVTATLSCADGSWAEVDMAEKNGVRAVRQSGPTRLWDIVERGFDIWESAGRPGWQRFGVTVSAAENVVWLDDPRSAQRWTLSRKK